MSFLTKLGLSPKDHSEAPVIGKQKKKKDQQSPIRNNVYIRVLIILGFLAVLFLSIPQPSFEETANYSIGEPWRTEDLTAPFTFAIQKSDEEIAQEEETIRQSTAPIFHRQPSVHIAMESRLDSLFQNIQPVLQAYSTWKESDRPSPSASTKDSLNFEQKKNTSGVNISNQAWNALLQNYQTTMIDRQQADTKTAPSYQFIGSQLRDNIQAILNNILNDGVINQPKSDLEFDEITVRNLQERTEQTLNTANVRDVQQANQYAQYRLSQLYNKTITNVGVEIFNQVIRPNLNYDADQTQARIDESIAEVSPTKGAIAKEQVIIRKGDLITQEKYNALKSLAQARSQNASTTEQWVQLGGDALAILAIVAIFFFYLYLYRRHIFMNNAMLLLVLLTMSLICVGSSLVYQFTDLSLYVIPIAITPIILTIIFDSRLGILASVTLALLIGLINSNSFEFVTATIVACCLGLFSVRDIKKRSQFFFTTPGIVFISYGIVIVGFTMASLQGWDPLFTDLIYVGINAIFILFTYPLILLFEKTFKITTDLTLIELSDTNLPLLKELMNNAPGTFHHSLQVANLAEAAAGAIRANGLLCHVAALYHDIGKMETPEYFAENQMALNPHDKLKPRMSTLVIKAHVTNGEKMAHEHKLPELLVDFINSHHGTSVIKFFYKKAKEQCDEDKDEIMEEDFRYEGPQPQTKETGILLLADGVEAASRAMKDPNYSKLKSLITKMVDGRVNDGQLSKTPLTFQDLSVIKDTFLNILVGIYHSRVEYPDDETDDNQETENKSEDTSDEADLQPDDEEWENRSRPPVDDYYNS